MLEIRQLWNMDDLHDVKFPINKYSKWMSEKLLIPSTPTAEKDSVYKWNLGYLTQWILDQKS